MAGDSKLSVTLSLVDKATAPIRAFSKAVNKAMSPFHKIKNKLAFTANELGIPKIKTAISGVGKATKGVVKEVKSLGKEFLVLGGLAAGLLGGIMYKTANVGDAAYKTAQKVGVSTRAWSELDYAAKMSGVSTSTLQSGLTRLNKQVTDAAQGNKTAAGWFKSLGVSIYDQNGKLRATEDVMADVADRMSKFDNGAKKSRLAMELFGKSAGPDMIPLLNAGAEGIVALREEAQRYGVSISDEQGKAAESFNDSLARVKTTIEGVTLAIGNQLIPKLEPLIQWVEKLIVGNRELISAKVGEWIGKIEENLPKLEKGLIAVWNAASSLAGAVSSLVEYFGGWGEVLPVLVAGLAIIKLWPLVVAVAALGKAFLVLGAAILTTPIGWIALAIAGLVAGFVWLYRHCETFRNVVNRVWEDVKSYILGAIDRIKGAFEHGLIAGLVAIILEFNPVTLIMGALNGLFSYIEGFSLDGAVTFMMETLWPGIKSVFSAIQTWIENQIKGLFNYFSDFNLMPAGFKLLQSLWTGLKNLWAHVKAWFSSAGESIGGFFDIDLIAAGVKILDSLFSGLKNAWSTIGGWLDSLIQKVKDAFDFDLVGIGLAIIDSLLEGLSKAWEKIESWFSSLGEKISGLIPASMAGLLDKASGIASGALDVASGAYNTVSGWFGGGDEAKETAETSTQPGGVMSNAAHPSRIIVEFLNAPENILVHADNGVEAIVRRAESWTGYNGARMGIG